MLHKQLLVRVKRAVHLNTPIFNHLMTNMLFKTHLCYKIGVFLFVSSRYIVNTYQKKNISAISQSFPLKTRLIKSKWKHLPRSHVFQLFLLSTRPRNLTNLINVTIWAQIWHVFRRFQNKLIKSDFNCFNYTIYIRFKKF